MLKINKQHDYRELNVFRVFGYQWWSSLVADYQALYKQLEAVESGIPSVGLVEETEDRMRDRITLYQVQHLHTDIVAHILYILP